MRALRIFGPGSALLLVALAAPSPAGAHLRTGAVAVGYGASIVSPRPSPGAPVRVDVYQSDRALHLSVRSGHTAVVLGYLGEPFLRLDAAGAAVNLASPTAAAAGLLAKRGRAAPNAAGWRLVRGRTSAVWHDPRVQRLPPGASRALWSVPILVDGRRERITGEIWRLPRPSLWPWLVLVTMIALLAATLGVGGNPRRLQAGAIVLGAVAAAAGVVTAAGFALDTYASPGTWIAGFDELAFAVVGFGVLARGPRNAHVPAGIGLGLLGLAIGLSKGEIYLYGGVLSALPATATRVVTALAVGAGSAGPLVGGLFYARTSSAGYPPRAFSPHLRGRRDS